MLGNRYKRYKLEGDPQAIGSVGPKSATCPQHNLRFIGSGPAFLESKHLVDALDKKGIAVISYQH
jgi:hypothetical protein